MESTEQEKMSKLFKAQFETLRGYGADPAAEKKAAEELQEALREQVLKMKRADYDAFKAQMRDSLGAAFRADFDEYMGAFERNSRDISLMDARQSFADYVGFLKENHQARNPETVAQKRDLEGAFLENARACIKNMGNDALLQKAVEAEYGELDEETRKGMTPHFVSRLKNLWNDPDFYNKQQEREQAEPAKEEKDEQKAAGEKEAVIEQGVQKGGREAVKTDEEDGKESGEDAQTAEQTKEGNEETTTTVVKTETGKSWQEAFAAAKVYAEENGKRPVRPTHVKEIDADGMGVQLESGASFRVNPHKEDTMTMNTLREGVHLEDCLTMVDALKEKGYTAINVSKGSEEFRKAMYIAARIHGLTPKGFDQEKAQIWEQEAAATRKAMYGETTGRATETKSAATQEKSSETKEKSSGAKEKTSETKEKTAEEKTSAVTAGKKFAAVTKEKDGVELDAEKVDKFMGVVYDIAAVNAAKDAKKLSKEQLKEVREAWAETGFKNVTASDVMRAAPDAPQEGKNNDVFKANVDAMVGAVAPKTINEIEAHSVATTLTPTKEQSAEIDAAVKKMIKVYEKQYEKQTGEKKSKKDDKEATTGVYATLKGMAREYGVTMDALQDAVMKNQKLALYGRTHPDFAEKIVTASFDHRKEGETSMYYQVQAREGEKMDRDTRVAVKNQKKAQKAEDKRQKQEMSAAAKTKLMQQGAAR